MIKQIETISILALMLLTLAQAADNTGDTGIVVAKVDGIEILFSQISIPMDKVNVLFKENMGRDPRNDDLATLKQLQTQCQCWLLYMRIHKIVSEKVRQQVSSNGAMDPKKSKALEQKILEEAATTNQDVAIYLKDREKKPNPDLEKQIFLAWHQSLFKNAHIEIFDNKYISCIKMFHDSVDTPSLATIVKDFFEKGHLSNLEK